MTAFWFAAEAIVPDPDNELGGLFGDCALIISFSANLIPALSSCVNTASNGYICMRNPEKID